MKEVFVHLHRLHITDGGAPYPDLIERMMEDDVGEVEIVSWEVECEKGKPLIPGMLPAKETTILVKYTKN